MTFFQKEKPKGHFRKQFFRWHEFSLYKWVELQQISHDRKMRDFFLNRRKT